MKVIPVVDLFRHEQEYIAALAVEFAELFRRKDEHRDFQLVADLEQEGRIAIWWEALRGRNALTESGLRGAIRERIAGFHDHHKRHQAEAELMAPAPDAWWG